MKTESGKRNELAEIGVIAGVNGAGKTTIVGKMLAERGVPFIDPDRYTNELLAANPGMPRDEANSLAWQQNSRRLRRAIAERHSYYFETTLGGTTITALLEEAIASGMPVVMWYVGLAGVERHIARVRARAAAGGHAIPEEKIRSRYDSSRKNLIKLLPGLAELQVLDNSAEVKRSSTKATVPTILHWRNGRIIAPPDLSGTPTWAKGIVERALRAQKAKA